MNVFGERAGDHANELEIARFELLSGHSGVHGVGRLSIIRVTECIVIMTARFDAELVTSQSLILSVAPRRHFATASSADYFADP